MRYHAVVIGAGLVGTACALALDQRGLRVAMIESRPPSEPALDWDSRIYAISPSSQALFKRLGVWGLMDASRLQAVYRMDVFGDDAGALRLDAYDSGAERLATILESTRLQWALWQANRQAPNVEILSPAAIRKVNFGQPVSRLMLEDGRELETELIIGADGRDSWIRAQADIRPLIEPYGQWWPISPRKSLIMARPFNGFATMACWPGCRCRATGCPWSGPLRNSMAGNCWRWTSGVYVPVWPKQGKIGWEACPC